MKLPFYTIETAAAKLGLSVSGVKHHIYNVGDLAADFRIGRNLCFTEETLAAFLARKRGPGRPKPVKKGGEK